MKDLITALGLLLVIVLAHALPQFIVQIVPPWFNGLMALGFFLAILCVMIWGINRLIERERNGTR